MNEFICQKCGKTYKEYELNDEDDGLCPKCSYPLEILHADNYIPLMKNEKENWEVEQMKKDIKKNNANFVWKEIEKYPVWQYRVKLRKLFFEAIKQLNVKFEME